MEEPPAFVIEAARRLELPSEEALANLLGEGRTVVINRVSKNAQPRITVLGREMALPSVADATRAAIAKRSEGRQ